MEVWLITETAGKEEIHQKKMKDPAIDDFLFSPLFSRTDQLPTPSYILCVGYFITWTMSVAFLVGLALVTIYYSSFLT
jgi:hypothetical protein